MALWFFLGSGCDGVRVVELTSEDVVCFQAFFWDAEGGKWEQVTLGLVLSHCSILRIGGQLHGLNRTLCIMNT